MMLNLEGMYYSLLRTITGERLEIRQAAAPRRILRPRVEPCIHQRIARPRVRRDLQRRVLSVRRNALRIPVLEQDLVRA